jgi:hypothetical protein
MFSRELQIEVAFVARKLECNETMQRRQEADVNQKGRNHNQDSP